MRILALETTERIGSVAAFDGAKLLCELNLDQEQRTAQSLAPAIKTLLERVGWKATQIELVAVSVGPGSFTGLRVGVTMAKTLAYSVKADILGIDTLEAIAAGAPEGVETLSVAIDAQRGDVVAGSFRRAAGGRPAADGNAKLISIDAWLGGLAPGTAIAGPVLRKLSECVPVDLRVLDPKYWPPTAANVARLAAQHYAAGRRDDPWSLVPRYWRRSAAEEKWEGGRQ